MDPKEKNNEFSILYPINFPEEDDFWNSNIDNVSVLDHVKIASCVTKVEGVKYVNLVLFLTSSTTIQDIIDDWWKIRDIRDSINNYFGGFPRPELSYHKTA